MGRGIGERKSYTPEKDLASTLNQNPRKGNKSLDRFPDPITP